MDIKIVHIAMDACWDDRSKWEIYNEKIHKRAHSVHNSKVIRTCLARGNIFENVGFPKKRDKTCRLLRNTQRQVSFHMYTDFWIMNTMCTFMYLFVVYFSFAPVISASIHRYVNYFDIQVLTMVTETETLTSTLHQNIFTNLDYVFFCYLHTVRFYPYLLSYLLIYKIQCVDQA